MITPENGAQFITNRYWRPQTYFGLSTDVKPTEHVVNGSVFIEMDTATVYFFDLAGTEWLPWRRNSNGRF